MLANDLLDRSPSTVALRLRPKYLSFRYWRRCVKNCLRSVLTSRNRG